LSYGRFGMCAGTKPSHEYTASRVPCDTRAAMRIATPTPQFRRPRASHAGCSGSS